MPQDVGNHTAIELCSGLQSDEHDSLVDAARKIAVEAGGAWMRDTLHRHSVPWMSSLPDDVLRGIVAAGVPEPDAETERRDLLQAVRDIATDPAAPWMRDLVERGPGWMRAVLARHGVAKLDDLPVEALRELAVRPEAEGFGGYRMVD